MFGYIVRMVCILALVPLSADADNWPQWRGSGAKWGEYG